MDLAFLCVDSAEEMIRYTGDSYVIDSVIIRNSDSIIAGKTPVRNALLRNGRSYYRDLLTAKFGEDISIKTASDSSVGAAVALGQYDAGVLDITKAFMLPETVEVLGASDNNYDTYVILAAKKFAETEKFSNFKKALNTTIEELDNTKETSMKKLVETYLGKEISERRWKAWKTEFIKIKIH